MLKLSVITPTLNQGKFIERTICSVLDQGYGNLEYMVVDGGSTDETLDVIGKYADRIDWWVSEPDEGQTHAINKGLERATGDIVAYINSDDYYLPAAFSKAIAAFERSDATWVAGAAINVDEHGHPGPDPNEGPVWIPKLPSEYEGRGPERYWVVALPWGVPQPAAFWRRELFERSGEFRRDMHFAFDVEFMSRLVLEGEMPLLLPDEYLAARVLHSAAKSSDTSRWAPEYKLMRRVHRSRLTFPERIRLCRWEMQQRGWGRRVVESVRFRLIHPLLRVGGHLLDRMPERIRPRIRTRDRRVP